MDNFSVNQNDKILNLSQMHSNKLDEIIVSQNGTCAGIDDLKEKMDRLSSNVDGYKELVNNCTAFNRNKLEKLRTGVCNLSSQVRK